MKENLLMIEGLQAFYRLKLEELRISHNWGSLSKDRSTKVKPERKR